LSSVSWSSSTFYGRGNETEAQREAVVGKVQNNSGLLLGMDGQDWVWGKQTVEVTLGMFYRPAGVPVLFSAQ
jgi:hypothetical protein